MTDHTISTAFADHQREPTHDDCACRLNAKEEIRRRQRDSVTKTQDTNTETGNRNNHRDNKMAYQFSTAPIRVESDNVKYTEDDITAGSSTTRRRSRGRPMEALLPRRSLRVCVQDAAQGAKDGRHVCWLGRNNGTTVTAVSSPASLAPWETRDSPDEPRKPDYMGSITQMSTARLGVDAGAGRYLRAAEIHAAAPARERRRHWGMGHLLHEAW